MSVDTKAELPPAKPRANKKQDKKEAGDKKRKVDMKHETPSKDGEVKKESAKAPARSRLLKEWYEDAAQRSFRLHPAWLYGFISTPGVRELVCEYAITVEGDAFEEALFAFPSSDAVQALHRIGYRRPIVTAFLLGSQPGVKNPGALFPFREDMAQYAPEFDVWMQRLQRDLNASRPMSAFDDVFLATYCLHLWYDSRNRRCNRPRCIMFTDGCTCGKTIKPRPNHYVHPF